MAEAKLCGVTTCKHAHSDAFVPHEDDTPNNPKPMVAVAKTCSRCDCKKFKK